MKNFLPLLCLVVLSTPAHAAPAPTADARRADTVILDAHGVKNLRLETALVEPGDFEETVFALGRIEVYPGNRAVVSSRIPGRALEVHLKHDHAVQQGDLAVLVESRQIGDTPAKVPAYAPISGLVSAVHVVPGEPVDPDKILAEIINLKEVYALARVPEHLAGRLRSGQTAHIQVAAASGQIFEAQLEHFGAIADPVSGTVEAAFHVDNPDLVLRPGMRAEFAIVVDRRTQVTSIPRSALQGTPANRFVYVKDFELPHAFIKTPVVVGQSNDRFVEIVSGLFPADEVVTQGAYSLAFAGAGNTSLKEALDAAHGHEHAADGSELKSNAAPDTHDHAAHDDHGHDHDEPHDSPLWKIVSALLAVALLIVSFRRKPASK